MDAPTLAVRTDPEARHAPRRIPFTVAALDALRPPQAGRVYVHDTRSRGLCLALTAAGSKVFYFYVKVDGRPERVRIGVWPDVTIEQARRRAAELRGDVATGGNPAQERRESRAEWTLRELFEHYLTTHAKIRKRTWREDEGQFKRYLEPWAGRRLSKIKRQDVAKLHGDIGAEAPYAANRLLALLRKLFNHASKHGWEGRNPCAKIDLFPEQSRERFLTADEMGRFFAALEQCDPDAKDAIELALYTGARRGNVLGARWDDIDLAEKTWTIPAAGFKGRRTHTLVLPTAAVAILKRRKAGAAGEFVFPSFGRTGHVTTIKKSWTLLLRRAGIRNLRFHDLRRSLGSWQAATGASLQFIGRQLGHKSPTTTAIYSRLNVDPIRDSVEAAVRAMRKAAKGAAK